MVTFSVMASLLFLASLYLCCMCCCNKEALVNNRGTSCGCSFLLAVIFATGADSRRCFQSAFRFNPLAGGGSAVNLSPSTSGFLLVHLNSGSTLNVLRNLLLPFSASSEWRCACHHGRHYGRVLVRSRLREKRGGYRRIDNLLF